MIDTFIDLEIINEYARTQPCHDLGSGMEDESEIWKSFFKYLRTKTNLFIYENEIDPLSAQLLKLFSTNRGDSKIKILEKFKKPYKSFFKPETPHTVYYLNERVVEDKKKYRRKNGFLFGFNDDYLDIYQNLNLDSPKLPKKVSVRKSAQKNGFQSWSDMQKRLLPFTDVLLVDNYILSNDFRIKDNLEKIMIELDKASTVSYNFTLVTYAGDPVNELNIKDSYKRLQDIKIKNKLKANISLVITTRLEKEHDRCIIMNYLMIDSGHTFNYFDSRNNVIPKTTISFNSLCETDVFNTAKDVLKDISTSISDMRKKDCEKYISGNLKNNLLDIH